MFDSQHHHHHPKNRRRERKDILKLSYTFNKDPIPGFLTELKKTKTVSKTTKLQDSDCLILRLENPQQSRQFCICESIDI